MTMTMPFPMIRHLKVTPRSIVDVKISVPKTAGPDEWIDGHFGHFLEMLSSL